MVRRHERLCVVEFLSFDGTIADCMVEARSPFQEPRFSTTIVYSHSKPSTDMHLPTKSALCISSIEICISVRLMGATEVLITVSLQGTLSFLRSLFISPTETIRWDISTMTSISKVFLPRLCLFLDKNIHIGTLVRRDGGLDHGLASRYPKVSTIVAYMANRKKCDDI